MASGQRSNGIGAKGFFRNIMKLFTVAEMIAAEKAADAAGVAFAAMMETAGRGVSDVAEGFRFCVKIY